jgi:hypothetical protein
MGSRALHNPNLDETLIAMFSDNLISPLARCYTLEEDIISCTQSERSFWRWLRRQAARRLSAEAWFAVIRDWGVMGVGLGVRGGA